MKMACFPYIYIYIQETKQWKYHRESTMHWHIQPFCSWPWLTCSSCPAGTTQKTQVEPGNSFSLSYCHGRSHCAKCRMFLSMRKQFAKDKFAGNLFVWSKRKWIFYLSAPCFLLPGFGANLLNSKQGRDKSRADKYIVFACRSKARTKSRLTFLSWHVETLTKWTGKCWPIPKFRMQKLLCIDPVWTRNQPAWEDVVCRGVFTTEHVRPVAGAKIAIKNVVWISTVEIPDSSGSANRWPEETRNTISLYIYIYIICIYC